MHSVLNQVKSQYADISQSGGPQKLIRTQLCLGLACLAAQVETWNNPLDDIFSLLSDVSETDGDKYRCRLELVYEILKVIPEEIRENSRLKIPDDKMDWFQNRVKSLLQESCAEKVLFICIDGVQKNPSNSSLVKKAMECISSWMNSNDISCKMVEKFSLIDLVFSGFKSSLSSALASFNSDAQFNDELFEIFSELIIEIIRISSDQSPIPTSPGATTTDSTSSKVLNHILQAFEPMFQAADSQKEEIDDNDLDIIQRNVCRIMVEAVESWFPYITNPFAGYPDSLPTLHPSLEALISQGLLRCSCRFNSQVVSMTFSFWFEISQFIQREATEQFRALFENMFKELEKSMITLLQYPIAETRSGNFEEDTGMSAEERDDFRDFRHYVGDILKDCARVIGGREALQYPYNLLLQYYKEVEDSRQQGRPFHWQKIESSLFAIRVLGSELSSITADTPEIPSILGMLPTVAELHPRIKYASVLVVGRYAGWITQHPENLGSFLSFISSGFNEGKSQDEDDLSAACALALRYLCESCGKLMVDYLNDLLNFYEQAVPKLKRYDLDQLTEAVAYIINHLPVEDGSMKHALDKLCSPIGLRISQLVSKTDKPSAAEENEMVDLIDRLCLVLKRVRPKPQTGSSNPCSELFQNFLPLFETLIPLYGSGNAGDASCRVFKVVILTHSKTIIPLVPRIIEILCNGFKNTQNPGFLWVSGHIVRHYGEIALSEEQTYSLKSSLTSLIEQMFGMVFNILVSVDDFNQMPDLTDDFFRLATFCVQYMPAMFYVPSVLKQLFGTCHIGLQSLNTDSLEPVILFLRDVLSECLDSSTEASKFASPILRETLQETGPILFSDMLNGVCGMNESKVAYSGHVYHDIAAWVLNWSELSSPDFVGNLLQSFLNNIQQTNSDKLTDRIKALILEDYKNAIYKQRPEPIRLGLASLGGAFRQNRPFTETMRVLQFD